MITFPMQMTYDEIAALPHAAECFCWDKTYVDDDTPDLASFIMNYTDHLTPILNMTPHTPSLPNYLARAGFLVADGFVRVRDEAALRLADAILNQIVVEYDCDEEALLDADIEVHFGQTSKL